MSKPRQEKGLRAIAETLDEALGFLYGERMGFALVVFAFNETGIADYVSNSERKDVIDAMRETAERLEKKEDIPAIQGEA
jgi:hypothetical protein